jgi:2-(1,2-epoxy-1,2-dihydrophenyl)acetyl-CoA isomerase
MGPIARYQSVLLDRAGTVGTITFNRPAAGNALDLTMREELLTALDDLDADETVRVVILTGAGGHFSAGGDVKTMVARHTAAEGRARVEMGVQAFLETRTPKFAGT